jgi:hypothetical protein
LEIVLDQWFYRHQLEEMLASITSEDGIKFSVGLRRHTYPGAFRWRLPPSLEASWIKGEPGWIFPSVEPAGIASDPIVVQLPLPDLSSPEEALTEVVGGVSKAISEHVGSGKLISFAVRLPASKSHLSGSIDTLINRCWDGIRLLPYRAEDLAYCLGLTVTLLVGRAMGLNVDDWPERLFGEVELLEVAPVGGHIEAGLVSKADLLAAFSSEHHPKLTAYMRRKAIEDPLFLINYIVDHWMIFEFEAFQRIFVRQLIPTMMDNYWREDLNLYDGALGCLWSINFNPALLGYVTHMGYRFTSPLGMQKDCSHIIYILPDMDQEDIAEAFISCMPWILGKGDPYLVLFHGYAHDMRNVWTIRRAIRHAKWICEVGGISVLEPMPSLQNPDDLVDEVPQGLLQANGMGALEVWLTAKEKLEKMNGKPLHIEHPVFKRFWSDLMFSNAKIDQLATAAPDWPGPLSEV